jgi:hypothetical protein
MKPKLKLSALIAEEWQGIDLDLATSLFEYGFAWRPDPDGTPDSWQCIFAVRWNDTGDADRFAYSYFDPSNATDVIGENGWGNRREFESFRGAPVSETDFTGDNLPYLISDLLQYYGSEEILGSAYWNGFGIKENK